MGFAGWDYIAKCPLWERFKKLTDYIPKLEDIEYGKVFPEKQTGDGSLERPFQMPYMVFADVVCELEEDVYRFERENPQYGLARYHSIFEEHGIEWNDESMEKFDVTRAEEKVVLALILGAFRAERFCGGALKSFLEKGCIQKWLKRLEEIDNEAIKREGMY